MTVLEMFVGAEQMCDIADGKRPNLSSRAFS